MTYDEFTVPLKPGTTLTIPDNAGDIVIDWGVDCRVITYRVPRPEPVIGEVVLYGRLVHGGAPLVNDKHPGKYDTHRFRFRTADGVSDGTFTVEEL